MYNPFPSVPSGSYKQRLAEGLRNIGEDKFANEFECGNVKLAIAATITGSVNVIRGVKEVCLNALNSLVEDDAVRYYRWGLENGQFVVASSSGAFEYDKDDAKAAQFAHKMSMQGTINFFNT